MLFVLFVSVLKNTNYLLPITKDIIQSRLLISILYKYMI